MIQNSKAGFALATLYFTIRERCSRILGLDVELTRAVAESPEMEYRQCVNQVRLAVRISVLLTG